MRLWPYQMLDVLPQKHLIAQWRECCAISSMIYNKGNHSIDLNKINHTTINRVKNYNVEHFCLYMDIVHDECLKRGYKVRDCDEWVKKSVQKLKDNSHIKWLNDDEWKNPVPAILSYGDTYEKLFSDYHNRIYYMECLLMFHEKMMTKQINMNEWDKIYMHYKSQHWENMSLRDILDKNMYN